MDEFETEGFGDWLRSAYNFEGKGDFTKYNMEVAYCAGIESVNADLQSLTAERDRLREALENVVSETLFMTNTYDSAVNAHDIARKALEGGEA